MNADAKKNIVGLEIPFQHTILKPEPLPQWLIINALKTNAPTIENLLEKQHRTNIRCILEIIAKLSFGMQTFYKFLKKTAMDLLFWKKNILVGL